MSTAAMMQTIHEVCVIRTACLLILYQNGLVEKCVCCEFCKKGFPYFYDEVDALLFPTGKFEYLVESDVRFFSAFLFAEESVDFAMNMNVAKCHGNGLFANDRCYCFKGYSGSTCLDGKVAPSLGENNT